MKLPVSGRRALLTQGAASVLYGCATSAISPERGGRVQRELRVDSKGLLALPPGFSYRVLQRSGATMSDGYLVPARPDAMGCFTADDGSLVLMRNHEIPEGQSHGSPFHKGAPVPELTYDRKAGGGVTRLVLDASDLSLRSSNLVLAGTYWNCAGGHSPWGWLSCEETVSPGHGYVFLCDPAARALAPPERIIAYGRFRHEAATVDPRSHIAYLSEDRPDSCLYRFVPQRRDAPFVGTLLALAIAGKPRADTSELEPGPAHRIEWIPLEHTDSPDDSLRHQAQDKGAAVVRRGEGLWLSGDELFVAATAGGPLHLGQILRLRLGSNETLDVVAQSSDPDELDMPDNVTVSPDGHVYIAEDGYGGNSIRRLARDGSLVEFARCTGSHSEFAGPCFSPDGKTLFVNLQLDGLTLAITGPFEHEVEVDRALSAQRGDRDAQSDTPYLRAGRGVATGLAVLALAAAAYRRRRNH